MKRNFFVVGAMAGLMLTTAIPYSHAADFTVNSGVTDNVAKALNADAEIGTVQGGGTLSSAATAISAGALNLQIINAGIIETTNAGAPAIVFSGTLSTGSTVTNSGIIRSTGGGAAHGIQITPTGAGVTVTNTGTISASGTGNAVRFVADNNTLNNSGTISTAGTDAIFVNGNNNRITLNTGSILTGGINFAGGAGNTLEYTVGTSCVQGGGICAVGGAAPTITGGTLGVEYTETVHRLASGNTAGSTKIITSGGTTVAVTQDNAGHNNTVEKQVTNQASDIATQKTQETASVTTTGLDSKVKQQIVAIKAQIAELEEKKLKLQETIAGIDGVLEKVKDSGQQDYIDHLKKQRTEKLAELNAIQAKIDQLLKDMPKERSNIIAYSGGLAKTIGDVYGGALSSVAGHGIGGGVDYTKHVDLALMTDEELTTMFWGVLFEAISMIVSAQQIDADGNISYGGMLGFVIAFAVPMLQSIIGELDYRGENTITGTSSGNAFSSKTDEMRAALKSKLPQLTAEQRAEFSRQMNTGKIAGKNRKAYQAWAEIYGSYRERPNHKDSVYAESRNGGIVAGVSLPDAINGVNYSVYASAFTGSTDIGKQKFRTIDTNGAMIGAVGVTRVNAYDVSANLSAGFSSNDSNRVVGGGSANAKADYNSYFASPSVTVSREFINGTIRYKPSVTGGYTLTRSESYTEHGSAANQGVDGKTSHMLSGRAQMEAIPLPVFVTETAILKHSYRAGVQGQAGIGDQSLDVTALGQNVKIDPDADRAVDGIIGVNLDYTDLNNGVNVYFDTEVSLGLNKGGMDDNKGIASKLGMRWSF